MKKLLIAVILAVGLNGCGTIGYRITKANDQDLPRGPYPVTWSELDAIIYSVIAITYVYQSLYWLSIFPFL